MICRQVSWEFLTEKEGRGFPGGPVVKNVPCNARDTSLIAEVRKILHATEQLSLCTTTTEPVL